MQQNIYQIVWNSLAYHSVQLQEVEGVCTIGGFDKRARGCFAAIVIIWIRWSSQAEITDLKMNFVSTARRRNQKISRAEVTMNHTALVNVPQTNQQLRRNRIDSITGIESRTNRAIPLEI